MSKYKIAIIMGISAMFFVASFSHAVTSTEGGGAASAPSPVKMLKVTGFIEKIENNVLYLENNQQYDLRNVQVTELSGSRVSQKKRTAEMLFVNGVLREVVIR